MATRTDPLPVKRQCELLDLPRSTFYHAPRPVSDRELELMALIDLCHLKQPFYGSRRIRDRLEDRGHRVNRQKIRPLMRTMDLAGRYPTPGCGVFHAVFTSGGVLTLSVLADRDQMPDPALHRESMEASFLELYEALFGKGQAAGKVRKAAVEAGTRATLDKAAAAQGAAALATGAAAGKAAAAPAE